MTTLAGLPAFLAYFAVALVLTALYLATYLTATAHREIALVREGNLAAALALGGSLLGYAIPLSAAIRYSARSSTRWSGASWRWWCRSSSTG